MPHKRPFLHPIAPLLCGLLTTAAACGGDVDDGRLLAAAGGDAEAIAAEAVALDYTVTSEDYRRWMAAEAALASVGAARLSDSISLSAVTPDDIDRVAAFLEQDATLRTAIESSGLTVREYVQTTVALEQALAASSPDGPPRFVDVPEENVIVADRNREEIERVRTTSPLRVDRSDDRWDDDSDGKRGRGKAKGRKKGRKDD